MSIREMIDDADLHQVLKLRKQINKQQRQINWLTVKLAERASKHLGLPKELMELSIRCELENME